MGTNPSTENKKRTATATSDRQIGSGIFALEETLRKFDVSAAESGATAREIRWFPDSVPKPTIQLPLFPMYQHASTKLARTCILMCLVNFRKQLPP